MAKDPQQARIVAHPLRDRLLSEYAAGPTSPSRLAAALGERLNLVSYHTAVLRRAGYLELVRTARRRGAVEHFYRAPAIGEIEDVDWARLPRRVRQVMVRRVLEEIWRDATEALPAGGMEAATTHISRTVVRLDAEGREALAAVLRATLDATQRIERASRRRGGDVQDAELAILSFTR